MIEPTTCYFGRSWGAPICEGGVQVATPTGHPCIWCNEEIVDGDQGTLMPVWDGVGDGTAVARPQHKECGLRAVIGSIGHLLGKCHCYGGDLEDLPQLSDRENARLVWAWVQTNGIG